VCVDDKDKVIGFIGVLSRHMTYNKAPLNVAVAHRFLVDPQRASSMLAVRLMKRFLSGPQDLSLSDGANDQGKKFWIGCGGHVSWLYSIDWMKLILPMSYCLHVASRKNHRWLASLLPLCKPLDRVGLWLFNRTSLQDTEELQREPLTPGPLLECIQQSSAVKSLAPVYTRQEIQWLYQFMAANATRGQLEGCLLRDGSAGIIGCYLYYFGPNGVAEIMLLCARKKFEKQVYQHLLVELKGKQAIGVVGRIEPDFMPAFGENRVLFKRGCWAMIYSRRSELLEAVSSGNVFFSKLEGELCLYGPKQILRAEA
jgi:hypothetical protein